MINSVTLVGNTGKDPEVRTIASGKKVASFSLATSEHYKNANGDKVVKTSWHNIKAWGALAEIAEKYIKKGHLLYIEGKIDYSTYDDKDGNKRYVTDIIANNIQMLGKKDHNSDQTDNAGMSDDTPDGLPWR